MKISQLVISMLLVAGVIIAFYTMLGTLASEPHYDVEINGSYNSTYNKINELGKFTNDTQERIREVAEKENAGFFTGTWDAFTITKEMTFGAAGVTFSAFGIMTDLVTNFFTDIGFADESAYVMSIVLAIISILITGALIFIITKRMW